MQYLDSDGNRVYVGNFDANGLNVNNYWDNNRNDNIGVASARQSSIFKQKPISTDMGFCDYYPLVDRIQPPSIRPISSIIA
jgi:hypothetical protein